MTKGMSSARGVNRGSDPIVRVQSGHDPQTCPRQSLANSGQDVGGWMPTAQQMEPPADRSCRQRWGETARRPSSKRGTVPAGTPLNARTGPVSAALRDNEKPTNTLGTGVFDGRGRAKITWRISRMKFLKASLVSIGFAGMLLCQDVAASLFTSAYLNIDRQELSPPGPNVSVFEDLQQTSSADNSPIGDAINPSVSYVTPNAVARARTGVLKVGVNAEANIPGVTVLGSSGRAEARWQASPVINVVGVEAGKKAVIPAHMRFEGSLGYRNNGYSTDTVYFGLGNLSLGLSAGNGASGAAGAAYTATYTDPITTPFGRGFRVDANIEEADGTVTQYVATDRRPPDTFETFRIGHTVTVNIEFLTGVPFDFTARLVATGTATVGDSGRLDWFSDAMNSAVWDGFGDVLIDDVAYSNFTAIDQISGLDLARAIRVANNVPVPAALGLLGLGLPLLAWTVSGRRRADRHISRGDCLAQRALGSICQRETGM